MVLFLLRTCLICNVEITDLPIYNLFCDLLFQDALYSECWKELEESGILRMTLVDHVFADVIQNGLSKEDILDMMELYGLIAKFSFFPVASKDEQTYFVPAQLRSSPAGLCEIKTSSDDPCPLYLHFLDGFVPHGLFPQLLARFIRWSSEHAPNQAPNLYHNGARLFIGRKNMYSLVLICRKRFIKIVLKQRNPAWNTPFMTTAQEVRVFLEDSLQKLSLESPWLRNLRCELCVACPSCLTHGEECAKHGSVCCAHDDCLHLLRVIPEEQLFCPKSFTDEALQIDGLNNWFQVGKTKVEMFYLFFFSFGFYLFVFFFSYSTKEMIEQCSCCIHEISKHIFAHEVNDLDTL